MTVDNSIIITISRETSVMLSFSPSSFYPNSYPIFNLNFIRPGMIDYSTISIVLTGIGLMIALTYYALTLRNQNKTRQAQLYMQLYNNVTSVQNSKDFYDVMMMEWSGWDDFWEKYGPYSNPDANSKRNALWYSMDGIGLLIKNDLVKRDVVYNLTYVPAILLWSKWKPLVEEMRARWNQPDFFETFEYLYDEMCRMRKERGLRFEDPVSLWGWRVR